MTKTYKAQLVPMEEQGYFPNHSILKCIKSIEGFELGDTCISGEWLNDGLNEYNIWWQAQRLIILNEHGTPIATYPNMPDTHCTDLADVRKWIDNGCSESVELEVGRYDMITHESIEPMKWNNTVKMMWG